MLIGLMARFGRYSIQSTLPEDPIRWEFYSFLLNAKFSYGNKSITVYIGVRSGGIVHATEEYTIVSD